MYWVMISKVARSVSRQTMHLLRLLYNMGPRARNTIFFVFVKHRNLDGKNMYSDKRLKKKVQSTKPILNVGVTIQCAGTGLVSASLRVGVSCCRAHT